MAPKGQLLIVGGHESKGEEPGENLVIHKKRAPLSHFEILGRLIYKIPRKHHGIEIIAAASSIPDEMEELYLDAYRKVGFTEVGIIKMETEADGESQESIARINKAHAVFFTGGDQNRLIGKMAGTKVLEAIKGRYYADQDFIVGGTSAGAMAVPETIIGGGLIREALFKDDINITAGLGLLHHAIVDTHFVKRGRFARLAHAVAIRPDLLGIGLGEDTSLLIKHGKHAECIGTGMVIIIDGSNIAHSNVNIVDGTTPIVMDNLKVSILADGSTYLLDERRWVA
jgi:cyanophycinase